jgi:hypothetical protein
MACWLFTDGSRRRTRGAGLSPIRQLFPLTDAGMREGRSSAVDRPRGPAARSGMPRAGRGGLGHPRGFRRATIGCTALAVFCACACERANMPATTGDMKPGVPLAALFDWAGDPELLVVSFLQHGTTRIEIGRIDDHVYVGTILRKVRVVRDENERIGTGGAEFHLDFHTRTQVVSVKYLTTGVYLAPLSWQREPGPTATSSELERELARVGHLRCPSWDYDLRLTPRSRGFLDGFVLALQWSALHADSADPGAASRPHHTGESSIRRERLPDAVRPGGRAPAGQAAPAAKPPP